MIRSVQFARGTCRVRRRPPPPLRLPSSEPPPPPPSFRPLPLLLLPRRSTTNEDDLPPLLPPPPLTTTTFRTPTRPPSCEVRPSSHPRASIVRPPLSSTYPDCVPCRSGRHHPPPHLRHHRRRRRRMDDDEDHDIGSRSTTRSCRRRYRTWNRIATTYARTGDERRRSQKAIRARLRRVVPGGGARVRRAAYRLVGLAFVRIERRQEREIPRALSEDVRGRRRRE